MHAREFDLSEQAVTAGQCAAALESLQTAERVVLVADTTGSSGAFGHKLEQFAVGIPLLQNTQCSVTLQKPRQVYVL